MAGGLDVGTLSGRIELEDKLTPVLEQINGKLESFDSKFGGVGKTILEQTTSFFTAEAALDAMKEAVSGATEELADLFTEGAKTADIEASFEHLTAGAGQLGDALIGKLQTATHGTVDSLTLMKTVNQDLAAGMKLSDTQMASLAQGALALSKATGQNVTDALGSMNDAMLTGRTRSIALLTGKIDLKTAEEAYAKSLGGTIDQLTAEGKQEADRQAILTAVAAATKRVGDSQDGLSQMLQRASASWADFQDELGKALATNPELIAGFKAIAQALSDSFGADKGNLIKTIVGYITTAAEDVLILAKYAAQMSGVFVDGYEDVKILFDFMLKGLLEIDQYALQAAVSLAKFTGAPKTAVADLNAELGLVKTQIDAFDKSITANVQTSNKWNDVITQIDGEIGKVQGAMADASAKATEHDQIMQRVMASWTGSKEALAALTSGEGSFSTATDGANKTSSAQNQLMAQSASEAKAQAAAMKEVQAALSGVVNGAVDYQKITQSIAADTLTSVDAALKAGVAQATVAKAYNLTAEQVKAADEVLKTDAAQLAALDAELGISTDACTNFGTTYSGVMKGTIGASASAGDAIQSHITKALDNANAAAQDVLGVIDELDNSGKLLTAGYTVPAITQQTIDTTPGGADALLKELKGLESSNVTNNPGSIDQLFLSFKNKAMINALNDAYDLLVSQAKTPKADLGILPSFAEGGSGDFGDGTLAVLHGQEVITPADKMTGGGSVTNVFHVNGTGAQVASVVSQEIMRQLKTRRQFPAS